MGVILNNKFLECYKQVSSAAKVIYLNPEVTHEYEEIITGVRVGSKTMMAVDQSTFQAFGWFNPNMFKVKECYIKFFLDNKFLIINTLNSVCGQSDIDDLENNIFSELLAILKSKTDRKRLDSYNRIRKPINLYLQHISFMAQEIDNRDNLCKYLHMPLDRVIFGLEPVFTSDERDKYGVSASLGFGQIKSKSLYDDLQKHFCLKAQEISTAIQKPFEPIYFDLFWNDRYLRNFTNLFYSNLKEDTQASELKKTKLKQTAALEFNEYNTQYNSMKISVFRDKDNLIEKEKPIIRRIEVKPELYAKFQKTGFRARELFVKLIIMADEMGIINKATKNDYRLVKKNGINNFCLITFMSDSLGLHIHRNYNSLHSDLLSFSTIRDGNHNGKDWIAVKVRNEAELEDVFRLISAIYQKE